MSDWNTFSKAYQNAPQAVQDFIDSNKISEFLEKHAIPQDSRIDITNTITDRVLGISDSSAFDEINLEKSVINDLEEFLEKLIKIPLSVDVAGIRIESEPLLTEENNNKKATIRTANPSDEIGITPLRTMSDDMKKVHGYGALKQANAAYEAETEVVHSSTQTDALQKDRLAKPPSYTEGEE